MTELLKLNLGCGLKPLEGYINVDRDPKAKADVIHDLEKFPWPFDSGSVGEIQMSHLLEHLGADIKVFFGVIGELYRVLALNGFVYIVVPHPRSDFFLGDPTHVRPIMPHVLQHFSKKARLEWQEALSSTGCGPFMCEELVDIDLELQEPIKYILMPKWQERINSGQMRHDQTPYYVDTFFNVVNEIHMTMVKAS